MRLLPPLLLVTSLVLAGCASSGGGGKGGDDDPTADLGLQATDTTGILRGVVVDERIVPIAGVAVKLLSLDRNTTTNDGGAFGFDGLAPGTYFVVANKAGFKPVQQGIDVVAGKDDPPVVRIQLLVDDSFVKPYFDTFVLNGYIQCGVTSSAIAVAVCSIPNGCNPGFGVCATNETYTQDIFNQFIPISGVPMHIQHEVIWDATQSTGDMLSLAMRTATAEEYNAGGYGADIGGDVIGTSPLLGVINATMIKQAGIGVNGTGLAPAVFTGGMEGTQVCIPDFGCLFANGAAINQKFDLYTHVFYGYAPPEGWRFSDSSVVPQPPSS
ncbi:MAG: carboxypeptidase-like regulatory domain-containing protein [Candidatus Thermoplasmatota archaeon]